MAILINNFIRILFKNKIIDIINNYMSKLLFVVHRYPPYNGGSEYYVQAMAEESLKRGHSVSVFTDMHNGDLNGVRVTNDINILNNNFDLIIVHGGNCKNQDIIHFNSDHIQSPILYMLILPSTSHICMRGLYNSKYIGCSTQADWIHVKNFNVENKSHRVRHGIVIPSLDEIQIGEQKFRNKFNITTKYIILTCGGFWRHKGMLELANLFNKVINDNKITDITLVCTGYNNNESEKPKENEYIKSLYLEDRSDVSNAMDSADLYIMNSFEEGFGLVLLEAMSKKVPWAARNIAGAKELKEYGFTYNDVNELYKIIANLQNSIKNINSTFPNAYEHVCNTYSIKNTIDDIDILLKK